jgi:tetratricopeptide (TPR) repeat protein
VHDGSRSSATERAELNLASAGIRSRQGRYRECAAFAIEAANEATRARHRSGLAHALYLQHMMSVYLGAPKDDFARRALAIFEELDDLIGQGNVLNNLGIGAYYRGEWVVALDHYERSRQARLRAGDVIGAATEENNVAEILSDQADFEGARSLFESARSTWLAAGYRVGAALATSNLGTLEARAGNLPTGRQLLEQAIDDFREIRSPVFRAETELRLVDCGVLEGDFTVAMAAARDLLDGVRGRPGLEQVEAGALRLFGTATALAALAEGAGEVPGESTQALDAAIDRATSLDVPYELALCLSSRAALVRLRPHDDQLGLDATKHGATTAADGPSDHDRAEAIFAVLGVRQAVITWSTRLTGAPIFAREDPSEATA